MNTPSLISLALCAAIALALTVPAHSSGGAGGDRTLASHMAQAPLEKHFQLGGGRLSAEAVATLMARLQD